MFDQKKAQQLENRSHVRGKLNKEFYSAEQQELDRKRRQMKMILDQQVEERRRIKEREKFEQERKIHEEEERIRLYNAQVVERERRISGNSSSAYNQQQAAVYGATGVSGVKKNSSGVYESRVSQQEYHMQRNTSKAKNYYQDDAGDLPVMPSPQKYPSSQQTGYVNAASSSIQRQYRSPHRSSAGNIPLLELTMEEQKKQKKKTKRNPTKRDEKEKYVQKERKPTLQDSQHQKNVPNGSNQFENLRQKTQLKEVFGDLNQQLEQQNKQLKKQLRKNEEAISLLMGAVRSNNKLDKFRVQAEKILHGQNSLDTKIMPVTQVQSRVKKPSTRDGPEKPQIAAEQKQSWLPKLKVRHQSIMHDYLFNSARKAYQIKAKTFK